MDEETCLDSTLGVKAVAAAVVGMDRTWGKRVEEERKLNDELSTQYNFANHVISPIHSADHPASRSPSRGLTQHRVAQLTQPPEYTGKHAGTSTQGGRGDGLSAGSRGGQPDDSTAPGKKRRVSSPGIDHRSPPGDIEPLRPEFLGWSPGARCRTRLPSGGISSFTDARSATQQSIGHPGNRRAPGRSHAKPQHHPEVILGSGWRRVRACVEEDLGLSIAGDLGFASLHLFGDQVNLTGIDQQWSRLGRAAVTLLVSQVQQNERGLPIEPMTLTMDGRWVEGSTTLIQPDQPNPRGTSAKATKQSP